MKKIYTALFLLLTVVGYTQSNNDLLIETSSDAALVVCGDEVTFTIKLTNRSSGTMNNIVYNSTLPNGVTLVNSQYTNTNTVSQIQFSIPDIPGNSITSFTYTAKGDCTLLTEFDETSQTNDTFVVRNNNSISYTINGSGGGTLTGISESFNVNFPELFVKVKDEDVNVQVGVLEKDADGTVFTREVEVVNSGLGSVNEFRLYIDYDTNIDFNELRLSTGQVLTPVGAPMASPLGVGLQRLTYLISDFPGAGGDPTLFEQNEKLVFIDNVSLREDDCFSSMATNYTAVYGCNNDFCEAIDDKDATSVNYLSFITGLPNFDSKIIPVEEGDLCGDTVKFRYTYTNIGSGSEVSSADTAFDAWTRDTASIFNNLGVHNISINGITISNDATSSFVFTSDPDGAGVGLDDIDKDGFYDDLPVGATITIDYEMTLEWNAAYYRHGTNTNTHFISTNRLAYRSNTCDLNTYTATKTFFVNTFEGPSSMEIPAEMVTDQRAVLKFNVLYYGILDDNINILNGTSNYFSRFTLPEGYVVESAEWFDTDTSQTTTLTANLIGANTYEVRGGNKKGYYNIGVLVECSDSLVETIEDVNWKMYYDVCNDYNSLELLELVDISKSIFTAFEKCTTDPGGPGGPGGGGDTCDFETNTFNVDRNTFGYVDGYNGQEYYTKSQLNSIPKVNANTPDIELDAAYPNDKVLVSATGILNTDGSEAYNEISFEMAFNLPDDRDVEQLKHASNGTLSVGGADYVLTNPTINIDTNHRITYRYTVPIAPVSGSNIALEVKDLEMQFQNIQDVKLSRREVHDLAVFRGKFLGKTTTGSEATCGRSKGTNFELYVPDLQYFLTTNLSFTCDLPFRLGLFNYFSATAGDDFVNEYRPILLENFEFTLPEGYQLASQPTVTTSPVYYNLGNIYSNNDYPASYSQTSNQNTINFGDVFLPGGNKQLDAIKLYAEIELICEADYVVPPYDNRKNFTSNLFYIDFVRNETEVINYAVDRGNGVSRTIRERYNIPYRIDPNQVQEGFERTTDWPIQYCNEATSTFNTTISNVWIALELKPGDESTILVGARNEDGSIIASEDIVFYGPINPRSGKPQNMLVRIKNSQVAAQTCVTVYPISEYRVCENDVEQDVDLIAGWYCDSWPLSGEAYDTEAERTAVNSILNDGVLTCQFEYKQDLVTLRYKTGDIDWEVNRLGNEVDLCEDTFFDIKVVSSKFANVYDTNITVDLPVGVSPSDVNNITYTFNGTSATVPATFIQQNVSAVQDLVIGASDLVTSLLVASGDLANADESTIPGIRLPGKNEITFRVNLTSDCNYNPGTPVKFFLAGTTNCSENISLQFDRFIPLKGLTIPNMDVTLAADNFLVCNELNEVTLTVANSSIDPIAQQQLVLTLPAGVSYANAVDGFPAPDTTTGDKVTWSLADIDTNRNQTFKINTRLTNLSGTAFEYKVETLQNGQATCITDSQVCDLEVTTASDTVEVTNTPFPGLSINPITTGPVCEGENVVVEVELVGNQAGGAYTYTWNVQPIATNGNRFTFRPLNSTTLQVTVQSVTNPAPNCSGTATIDVEVYPGANLDLQLVEGVSCEGQADGKVTMTITGEQGTGYLEQEPFEIVSATNPSVVTIGQQLASGEVLTIENLPEGDFGITLKDRYGCQFERTITVNRVPTPLRDFCVSLLPCAATGGDVEMSFSTIDVHSALTGTVYNARVYHTTGGANTDILTFTGTFADTQTRVLSNVVSRDSYVLEITAANGCVFTRPFSPNNLQLQAEIGDGTDLSLCFANETVDVPISISDNVNQCTVYEVANDYTVFFGEGNSVTFTGDVQEFTTSGSFTLEELGEGNYRVEIVPNNITSYSGSPELCKTSLDFSVTTASQFSVDTIVNDPTCNGEASGSAEVVVYGSYGNVTYEWVLVSTGEVVSEGYRATELVAGTYRITIVDESMCAIPEPTFVTLSDPTPLDSPIIEDIQTSCDASAGSGTPGSTAEGYTSGMAPYTFAWYLVTEEEIFDADGNTVVEQVEALVFQEVIQEGEISSYPGIVPGNYKVVVTDANGCTAESSVTAITQPPVVRKYNICLSWETPSLRERNEEEPDSTRTIPPIPATSFRQAIAAKVERCVIEKKDQLEASVNEVLYNAGGLDDAVVLDYTQGASDTYHFTLYYYDRSGNLVRTVPPEGVQTVNDRIATAHTYVTGYDYNSISQLASQNTPDGGSSQFVYNDIGQLWYSQNERQVREGVFSYVVYDELGRVREGGEAKLNGKVFPTDFLINNQANPQVAITLPVEDKVEYIQTTYNDRIEEITYQDQQQRFLRNNVSFINNKDKNGKVTKTYYSYDPHGNVEWCVQELPGIGRTTVAYTYDLVSGNVNEVHFNKGRVDEYRHKYAYDEDNRIISVKTSKDGYLWDEDARYDYYLHGPLARTELGEDKVQGLDFTYTIHGWLKGINTPDLAQNAYNPDGNNKRGDAGTKHAKDEFGMALGYYQGDFTRDGVLNSGLTAANPFNLENAVNGVQQNLYNGNISTWTSQIAEEAKEKNRSSYLTGNAYRYDQLNRIKEATTKLYSDTNQTYAAIGGNANAFMTSYEYDKNGNLQRLQRHKEDGLLMDDLTYHYDLDDPNLSNRLTYVDDAVGQISPEINDLPDQNIGNYEYDEIGQLIRDNSEGLTYVWTAAGKVSEIIPDNTNNPDTQKVHMSFTYDGMGMRALKQVNRMPYNDVGEGPQIHNPAAVESTYYTCDASGNVMGIYKREDVKVNPDDPNDNTFIATFSISERPIYGSDRIGQDVFAEIIYTNTYAFDSRQNYEEVAVQFMRNITSAMNNVFLVQNDSKEITDADGNPLQIEGTKFAKAKADRAFNALQYQGLQQENEVLTPIITDNNVFLIEDAQGEMISYGAVATNYFNDTPDRSVLLIYDKNGDLVPGLDTINTDAGTPIDPQAKAVVVKNPTYPSEYLVFYRDIAAGLHCATVSDYGFGPQITNHQNFSYSNYGRHMAVIQDEQNKMAYLYATMHTEGTVDADGNVTSPPGTNLVRFTIDSFGNIMFDGTLLPEYFSSFDKDGNGELQIAIDGSAISVYHNTSLPAQWTASTDAEIRTWKLDADTKLPIVESVSAITVTNGNIGKGSLINTGDDIYYTQYTQDITTNADATVVKRVSDNQVVANTLGDLRINKDEKLYQFARDANTGQEWNLDTQTSIGLNNLPIASGGATGYQPYQAYTILTEQDEIADGLVYRDLGNKYYEIKDHINNVRVVVGDRKNLDPATGNLTAKVESYNNYYAFGMLQPNRHKDSKSYRYGFQGQEKDDEIKGEGNSVNFKFRMHDPRLGRFFAVDPLTKKYPHYSPFSFSGNKTVNAIELEGLEERYIVFSNMQADKMKCAFEIGDYIEVARIADYGMSNGFVDDNQNPSLYIYNKLRDTYDYEFLRKNTAAIVMFRDEKLQKGIMVFEKAVYAGETEHGDPIIEIEELGTIDLNEIKREANAKRWAQWFVFMKENDYPSEHFEEFRNNGAAFANGGDVSSPPVKNDLKWPTGAFDTNPHTTNRSNQGKDVATWSEFIEDYSKNPEKYRQAARDYFERFYAPAIKRQLMDKEKEYIKLIPNEFNSREELEKSGGQ
ncbi:RHS repeat-associated core domain-containing protein [Aquimarina gracilis]|uniref:RHS repeat-associated core domain-containing protein n=1 Tax=Aquimarina gracilis TaxID=874422 RepID=A0ABU5ZW21_9FLAO|nr:RHS repeat-associated core domain-containing protein [Aquimarina gracilis]MEB3346042.1 RHS repeat-associated core domain-containing protein [Aquimarina gracilis]